MKYLKHINDVVKTHSKITYQHTIFCLFLAFICFVGLMVDDRMLDGISVWLKPLKFSLSVAMFTYTIGYFTHLYNFKKLKRKVLNHIVSWTGTANLLIIITQGARGVKSHYNMTSLLDGMLFAAMGILVSFSVIIMLVFIIDTLRRKPNVNLAILVSLFIGWVSILYSSYVGGKMLSQMSHNVGFSDGGDGMFLVNWSLEGGDLRIAHFLGLHAIQIIPIVAYFINKRLPNSPVKAGILSTLFGISYLGLIVATYYQAKNGIPLIALSLS